MRKVIVLCVVFLLNMGLVSAGFWGDSLGFLITGNVVDGDAGILEGEEASGGGESAPSSDSGSSSDGGSSEPVPSGDSGSSGGAPSENPDYSGSSDQGQQEFQEYQRPEDYQQYQGDQRPREDYQQYQGSPEQYQRQCPDENALAEMNAKCKEHGGSVTERTDPYSGCTISECFFNGGQGSSQGQFGQGEFKQGGQGANFFGEQACQSEEEAEEQSSICGEFGSEAIAVPSPPGCAPRIVCAQKGQGYGSGHLSYDEYQQGQDRFDRGELGSAQVLEVILKMDSIKIQLDGVQQKMESIAGYYEKQGDTESAENYRDGAAILDQVASKIDEQKTAMKSAVESGTLDYETIYQIRSDLRYSVDELLNQVISALLGVEYLGIAEKDLEASDCGSNGLCFEDYFRNCVEGSSFSPEPSVTINIDETTENDECVLQISSPMGSGTCTVPNYRYATLSKESIMPFCDFSGGFEQYSGGQEFEDSEEFVAEPSNEEDFEEQVVEPVPEETPVEEVLVEEPVVEQEIVEEEQTTETSEVE